MEKKTRATMQVSELRNWARKMGYQGDIPDDFELLNESTEHIWRQVVDRIKPKHEVQVINRNILLEQLKTKKTGRAHVSNAVLNCPNHEYEVWMKKQELQKKLGEKKRQVAEARETLSKIERETHFSVLQTAFSEAKIKESESKHFLYVKKQKQLVRNIEIVQNKLRYLNETIHSIEMEEKRPELALNLESLTQNVEKMYGLNESIQISLFSHVSVDRAEKLEKLRMIYAQNDREHLVDVIQQLSELKTDEIVAVCEEDYVSTQKTKEAIRQIQADHLTNLHAVHVEMNLENISLEKQLSNLQRTLQQVRSEVSLKLSQHGHLEQHEVDVQIDTILQSLEYEALNDYYTECLSKPQVLQSRVVDLAVKTAPVSKRTLDKSRKELKNKVVSIQMKYDAFKQLWQDNRHQHQDVLNQLRIIGRKTSMFTTMDTLLLSLTAKNASIEVETMQLFNLEYNRKLWHSRDCLYYRDTSSTLLPFLTLKDNDDEILKSVVRTLGILPLNAECLKEYYRGRVEHRRKLEAFQQEESHSFAFDYSLNKHYMLKDLQSTNILQKEGVIEAVQSLSKPLPLWSMMDRRGFQQSMKLFIEMPFDAYVPKSVLYKGKSYDEYQHLFNESYLIL